jgi:hypothetical protein
VDGYFVDFDELAGLRARFSQLQSDAGSFFRGLGELHPNAAEFPGVAADSQERMLRHSSEAVTAAGLLSAGHQSVTQRMHTMGRNYAQAEQANDVAVGGRDVVAMAGEDRPEIAPVISGASVSVGTAIASITGMMRAVRLGRSAGLPLMGSIGGALFNMAALLIILENYRDAGSWEARASAATQVKESVSDHQDSVYEGVLASNDHLDGTAGDAFRASVTSHIATPYGVLADATGEMSDYALAAADAQQTFNHRVTVAALGIATASTTLSIFAPPLQMAIAAIWFGYVSWCRDELKKGFDAAATHLAQTGPLTDENERLRRAGGASSTPRTVEV